MSDGMTDPSGFKKPERPWPALEKAAWEIVRLENKLKKVLNQRDAARLRAAQLETELSESMAREGGER
ncbi:hypothetical protein ES703_60084 [subsurface metagenome]